MTVLTAPIPADTHTAPAPSPRLPILAYRLLILLLLAVGVFVRCAGLGRSSLWFDEGYTAWIASLSARHMLQAIRVDTAPPLYYLALHSWTQLFGRSEAGLRSLSAVLGSAALGVNVLTARRLLRSRSGRLAATALFAAAYIPIAFAHEARFYTAMLLLTSLSLYGVIGLTRRASGATVGALVLCWTASLYVNNAMLLYVAASALAWLWMPGPVPLRKRLLQLTVAAAVTAALYLPWLPVLLQQSQAVQGNFWQSRPLWGELPDMIARLIGICPDAFSAPHAVVVATLLLLTLACAVALLPRSSRISPHSSFPLASLLAIALGPVAIAFAASRLATPVFLERSLIGSCAALPLLLAAPLEQIAFPKVRLAWSALLLILFAGMVRSAQGQWLGEHPEDWRGISAYIQTQSAQHPGPRLVLFAANEGELLFDFYARHQDYTPAADLTGAPASFFAADPPRTMRRVRSDADLAALRTQLAQRPPEELFYVRAHPWWADPDARIFRLIEQRYDLASWRSFGDIVVFRFVPQEPMP